MKILGCVLIITGCIGLAHKYINKCKNSIVVLSSIISGLKEIADGISFLKKPIPDIITSMHKSKEDVFFTEIEKTIAKDCKTSTQKAWENALKCEKLHIPSKAEDVLANLGKILGKQTSELEEENINIAISGLCDILKEEEEKSKNDIKMMGSLGVLSGILIVILFI